MGDATAQQATSDGFSSTRLEGETDDWVDGDGNVIVFDGNRATPNVKIKWHLQERIHLEFPDFEIPPHGGGSQRQPHKTDFNLEAVGYARSKVKNGNGPGGAVGVRYEARRLEISDKALCHRR